MSNEIISLGKKVNDLSFCLEQANEENGWLMKEIHHRVKNNLQIVISLLNTQSTYLTSDEAIEAIKSSQHRMYAISLIHQKLYQTESLSKIDMRKYTGDLLEYLIDAYDTADRVVFKFEMVPLSLDVSKAIPLGIIINETISNILKHAFPELKTGTATVKISTADQFNYEFSVGDNGIGLSKEYVKDLKGSFGFSLIAGLTLQLQGTYEILNDHGVLIKVRFQNKVPRASRHKHN
ncbi:MAG TPA: sensor histidine kinase [Mucilaginibacter sp.]